MKSASKTRFNQINTLVDEVLQRMPKGSRTQQLVLLVLWRLAAPSGAVRVNKRHIGKLVNIEPRQIAHALRDLEEWKIIKRLPQKDAYSYRAYAINYDPTLLDGGCAVAPKHTR